jgi:hypothetical protein
MIIKILIDFLLFFFLFFRILAIKITLVILKTNDYYEFNPLMRYLIKHPKLMILYNVFFFLVSLICNFIIFRFYNYISIIYFFIILVVFLITFFDFFYDFMVYRKIACKRV